ncbi:MAG: hypothetical protein LBS76_04965 [Mycoplasmataceae bacterium]|jgi:p-aminobenzoyl-glutamate transporter AbgT|nr:hypothetical protein [Mycoplasmataceae bacterium]
MLNTILALSETAAQHVNWFLIVGLTIIIAIPFIASSIIIPILLKYYKNKDKHKASVKKSNFKSAKKKAGQK